MNQNISRLINIEFALETKLKEAKEEIRLYLKEKGTIEKVEEDEQHNITYIDYDGNPATADYSTIELRDKGKHICIMLTDEHWFFDDELTIDHILIIISIIRNGHGKFNK